MNTANYFFDKDDLPVISQLSCHALPPSYLKLQKLRKKKINVKHIYPGWYFQFVGQTNNN